ncbi:MAG: hypothetical protein WDN31_19945 [Hyphomicrobium sp.]
MRSIILGSRARFIAFAAVLAGACALAGCGGGLPEISRAEQPLSKETMSMLGAARGWTSARRSSCASSRKNPSS